MEAFVEAYNEGDPAALERCVQEHYAAQIAEIKGAARQIAGYWHDIYREYGPVRLHSVITQSETSIEVWLRGEVTHFWVGFGLEIEGAGPNGISNTWRIHGSRPSEAGEMYVPRDAGELADHLAPYMRRLEEADLFSGSIIVAKDGVPIFSGAYGLADRERGVRNSLDTLFNIASLSKMFTAVAVAQLADRETIALDEPIQKWIPELPEHISSQVTPRHLLTHTSGIELDGVVEYNAASKEATSPGELVRLMAMHIEKLPNYENFAPPGKFDYSNEGYDLLGSILERNTHQGLFALLKTNVFEPAGMTGTVILERDNLPSNAAIGYTARHPKHRIYLPEPRKPNTQFLDRRGRPSGGLYSTTGDLLRFSEALKRGKLLGQEMTELTQSRLVEVEPGKEWYGLGIRTQDVGVLRWGHSGGDDGASARLDVYPELGYTVIVLSNAEGSASHLAEHIRDLLAP